MFTRRLFKLATKQPISLKYSPLSLYRSTMMNFSSENMDTESYIKSRYNGIPDDSDLSFYTTVGVDRVEDYVESELMQKFNYSEEDIEYLMYFNQKVALPPDHEHGAPVTRISDYFESKLGLNKDEIKEILLRYPRFIRSDQDEIEERIKFYQDIGMNKKSISREEIIDIFKAQPFYFLCPKGNYPQFINDFRQHGFSKDETIQILKDCIGILGVQRNTIRTVFNYACGIFQVTQDEFKQVVLAYPEYLLQNRRHILLDKSSIVLKNSNCSQYYIRRLFLRHPTLFLKSLASFKVKTRFLIVEMGRNLKYEKMFPLLLKFNYGDHIKPRCELVYDKFDRDFELTEVLKGTDQEF